MTRRERLCAVVVLVALVLWTAAALASMSHAHADPAPPPVPTPVISLPTDLPDEQAFLPFLLKQRAGTTPYLINVCPPAHDLLTLLIPCDVLSSSTP